MKIGKPEAPATLNGVGGVRPAPGETAPADGARKAQSPGQEASAQVALSENAAQLLGTGDLSGDFDAAKVERISQSIADGSFQVNPEAIADKLLANARELLGKVNP